MRAAVRMIVSTRASLSTASSSLMSGLVALGLPALRFLVLGFLALGLVTSQPSVTSGDAQSQTTAPLVVEE